MLKTVGDEQQGARLMQRRYRDFEKLHTGLTPFARRTGTTLPPLPSNLTFGRKLSTEFAQQRQEALQQWLSRIASKPPLWCDALRLFLGLEDEEEGPGASGGGGGGALVLADDAARSGAGYADELRWIVQRAQQTGCGVPLEGPSKDAFKASTLVRWLAMQALVTSREQAVPLGEAMRRQGLIEPVAAEQQAPFADGAVLYRFVSPPPPARE